jgi:hypothetical protein
MLVVSIALGGASARADVSFVRDIAPILQKRCAGCHGERINLGRYRVTTFKDLMRTGDSGAAPVVPGKPEASHLLQLVTAKSASVRMPQSDDPLSTVQIGLLRAWIAGGAHFDGPDPALPLKSLLGPRPHPAAPHVYRDPVPALALAFGAGGDEIFAGGYNEVTVWNAATGALVHRIGGLPQRIQSLAFNQTRTKLLVGGGTPGEYGEVSLVDVATGRVRVLDTFNDVVLSVAFSADGTRAAAGSTDTSVRVYATDTGQRQWAANLHSDWVMAVSFSADGRFLASASKDMTVKIYEAATGALFTTYNGHNRQIGKYKGQFPVYAARFAPDSSLICSAGGGDWIHVWDPVVAKQEAGDAADMEERFAKASHTRYIEHGFAGDVMSLCVRDGQVFAASADGQLKQFDLGTLKEIHAFHGSGDWLFGLDCDAGSHRVAVGDYTGHVTVWDTTTGQRVAAFIASPQPSTTRQAASLTAGKR